MREIDADGANFRSRKIIVRVQYQCERPGKVYCVDTCHKIRKWGFIAGCMVDACSRFVLASWIADNNRSLTSLEHFIQVLDMAGVPEFVRADEGTETKAMEKLQNFLRGDRRFLTGPSTANVRVEVHHGRVTKKVLTTYRQFFILWGKTWLRAHDPLHRFLLWHVFAVRIQEDMDQYRKVWNYHRIRTIGFSPMKAFQEIQHRRLPMPRDQDTTDFISALRVQYQFDQNALNPLAEDELAELVRLVPRLTLADPVEAFLPRVQRGLQVLADIFQRREEEG
jgi:hypothetical protein